MLTRVTTMHQRLSVVDASLAVLVNALTSAGAMLMVAVCGLAVKQFIEAHFSRQDTGLILLYLGACAFNVSRYPMCLGFI